MHFKIPVAGRETRSKFQTENPQMLGATLWNSAARATRPGFVQPCFRKTNWLLRYTFIGCGCLLGEVGKKIHSFSRWTRKKTCSTNTQCTYHLWILSNVCFRMEDFIVIYLFVFVWEFLETQEVVCAEWQLTENSLYTVYTSVRRKS